LAVTTTPFIPSCRDQQPWSIHGTGHTLDFRSTEIVLKGVTTSGIGLAAAKMDNLDDIPERPIKRFAIGFCVAGLLAFVVVVLNGDTFRDSIAVAGLSL